MVVVSYVLAEMNDSVIVVAGSLCFIPVSVNRRCPFLSAFALPSCSGNCPPAPDSVARLGSLKGQVCQKPGFPLEGIHFKTSRHLCLTLFVCFVIVETFRSDLVFCKQMRA